MSLCRPLVFVDKANLHKDEALEALIEASIKLKESRQLYAGRLLLRATEYTSGDKKIGLNLEAVQLLQHYAIGESQRALEDVLAVQPTNKDAIYLQPAICL